MEEEELKMKNKADREAARKKKKAERMRNRKLKLQNKEKSPFIQQFSSGRKEVWIMSGTEVPLKSDQQNRRGQRGVANQSYEATIDDYYTTFTHSEVCLPSAIYKCTCVLDTSQLFTLVCSGFKETCECFSSYSRQTVHQNWVS